MAKYKLKKMGEDLWRVWARYQPFKGAATKSKIVWSSKAGIAKAAQETADWVKAQRDGQKPG